MADRPFRRPESIEAERVTWERVPDFLEEKGFTEVRPEILRKAQTIIAISPSGERLVMRVRQCWRREEGSRDSDRIRTYSATQLMSTIQDNDWEGSIEKKIDREKRHGVTHFLFAQRDGDEIKYAALVPLDAYLPIWSSQAEISDRLIRQGELGKRKKNHARNGSSPTIYLQDDRGGQEVANALWNYSGVFDVAKFPTVKPPILRDEVADRVEFEEEFVPEDGDRRISVQRQIKARRGQQKFRDDLCSRFEGRCVISGCEVLAVLEAAHISPYRGDGDNHPENGLLLRADLHTLFDLDLIGIEPITLTVQIHKKLALDPMYSGLKDRVLAFAEGTKPALKPLQIRYEQFLAASEAVTTTS